jgi:hypothetical protein
LVGGGSVGWLEEQRPLVGGVVSVGWRSSVRGGLPLHTTASLWSNGVVTANVKIGRESAVMVMVMGSDDDLLHAIFAHP